jgi:hypothetical protein
MYDGAGLAFPQQLSDELTVANIPLNKLIPRIVCDRLQIAKVSGIGKFVEVHERCGRFPHLLQDKVGPDKPGTAGDKKARTHLFEYPFGPLRCTTN